jgi:hypothetical protein
MSAPTHVTVMYVADLRARQVVWPDWMATACEGRDRVTVTTAVTPFGEYVVAIEPAPEDDDEPVVDVAALAV